LTSNATFTTSGEVTVTVGTLTDGKTPITVTGDLAGDAEITLSAPGRLDYVVNVTVTDPKLVALQGSTSKTRLLLTTTNQTITIKSEDLPLPLGTVVTTVASDDSLITVVPSTTDTNGDAVVADASGAVSFDIKAVRGFDTDELITFIVPNYGEVVVNLTTAKLQSADVVASEIAEGVYSYKIGLKGTATINVSSSDVALIANATVVATNARVTVVAGTLTADGKTPFTIKGESAGSAVLTFSAPDRADLVVNVTVDAPYLTAISTETVAIGQSKTITINSNGTANASSAVSPVMTIVSASSVAAGTTTLTTSAAHSFAVGTVVTITGLSPASLNGVRVVTAVTDTTFTFAVPAGVANATAIALPASVTKAAAASITLLSASNIATAATTITTAAAHGLAANDSVTITGLSPASLNGVRVVTATPTATTFTFAVPAGVANGDSVTVARASAQSSVASLTKVSAVSADVDGVTVTRSGVLDDTFVITGVGLTEDPVELTFTRVGFAPVSVEVVVTQAALSAVSDVIATISSASTIADGSTTITTSAAHGFAEGDDVIITGLTPVSLNGEWEVTAVTATTFSFDVPGTETGAVTVTGGSAKRTDAITSFDMFTSQSVSFDLSSTTFPLSSDIALEAEFDEDVVDVEFDGKEVTIKALTQGSTLVTISDSNDYYTPVTIDVATFTSFLRTDAASYEVIYGQTTEVIVSSDEVQLTTGSLSTLDYEDSEDKISVSAPRLANGELVYTVTALSAGTATLKFEGAGFTAVTATVVVTKASLNAQSNLSTIFTGDTALISISSDENPISAADVSAADADAGLKVEIVVPEESSDEEILTLEGDPAFSLITPNIATVVVKGVKAGASSVKVTLDNYEDAVVQLTVTTPDLKTEALNVRAYVGVPMVIEVGSDEKFLDDSVTVNAVSSSIAGLKFGSAGDCAGASDTGEGVTAGGTSSLALCGVTKGSYLVTMSAENYSPLTIRVVVINPILLSDEIKPSVFVKEAGEIEVSASETGLPDDLKVTATSSTPGAISFESIPVPASATKESEAPVTISGATIASDVVTVTTSDPHGLVANGSVTISGLTPASLNGVRAVTAALTATTFTFAANGVVGPVTAATGEEEPTYVNTVDVASEEGVAKFRYQANFAGLHKVVFSAAGFQPVTVIVTGTLPALVADVPSVIVNNGATIKFAVSSNELDIADDVTPTASVASTAFVVSSATPVAARKTTLTTAAAHGFVDGDSVTVTGLTPSSLNGAQVVTAVTDTTFTFAVPATVVDGSAVTVASATVQKPLGLLTPEPSASGEAVIEFTAAAVGAGTITVAVPNYKPVTVRVTVLPARLELDVTTVSTTVWGTTQIIVSSPDSDSFDPADLAEPVVAKDSVATVTLLDDESSEGQAVYEVEGLEKGSTTVTFAGTGFLSVRASIKVALSTLAASSSTQQIFAGEAGSVTISSPDLALTGDIVDASALEAKSSNETAVVIGTEEFPTGIEVVDETLVIHYVGELKGRSKITVSGTGFTRTGTTVNVVEPALLSNVSTLAFRADKSATFKISSNDLPLADDIALEFDFGSLEDPAGAVVVAEGVATVTLTGPEILAKEVISLKVSAEGYKSRTIKVTVTPAPVCVAAKSLGSIRFSDTDAKLTSASTANIKKFAADLVNNNCSAARLTSYVPVANTKANAAKYAKELQLAASRESAVRSVLTAEVTKLKGTVTVTVVKGSVPANVLTGSTAAQSAYRKIDVATDVLAATPFRLRNLI
jgi:hypothetical protein